jgi:hypothetical protein
VKAARVLAALLAVQAILVVACTPRSSAVGPGQECFAASECEPGLVCVPQEKGGSVCSNDLSQITGRPPMEAAAPDAGEAGDAQADGPELDGPVQDTGTDTGIDTGIKDAAEAG